MNKLSIITINLNNKVGLQRTMESVFAQSFNDYEYIIVDGGSTDGSKSVIAKEAHKLAYWVSGNDNGIFHAMNKGIEKASGEYLLFLNSGDRLYDNIKLEEVLIAGQSSDIIYGNVLWRPAIPQHDGIFPAKLSIEYFVTNSLPHQGAFIRKKLFDLIGLYDEKYDLISDWLFFLLAIHKYHCSYKHVNQPIATCDTSGVSLRQGSWPDIVEERKLAFSKYFDKFAPDYERFYVATEEINLTKGKKSHWFNTTLRKMVGRIFKATVPKMYSNKRPV